MKYGYAIVNINPTKPMDTVGFDIKKPKVSNTRLDLDMRLLRLVDVDCDFTLLTLDSLNVSNDVFLRIKEVVRSHWPTTELNISTSHTHFAPSLVNMFPMTKCNEEYLAFVLERLNTLITNVELKEIDGYVDYHYMSFNKVGKSRITNEKDENVYASVLSLFDGNQRLGSILFYNCHPTIDNERADYFSSEYVGYVLQRFETQYPNEFFLFLQGADGDISTRFVRKEKTFNEVCRLGELLGKCFDKLIVKNKPVTPLTVQYHKEFYTFPYTIKEADHIDQSYLNSLDAKEAGEILAAFEIVKMLSHFPNLPKNNDVCISRLQLGKYRLMFSPFELFSSYNNMIDRKKDLLIGYTNGSLSYLTPLHSEKITYEYFMEIVSDSVKELIVSRLLNM